MGKGEGWDFKSESQDVDKDWNCERPLRSMVVTSWKIQTSIEIYLQRSKANSGKVLMKNKWAQQFLDLLKAAKEIMSCVYACLECAVFKNYIQRAGK